MRKKILMIGDTETLAGVSVDIADYYDFFTSPAGGHWCNDEIEILENPEKRQLFKTLAEVEEANYDYVITTFSGHGMEVSDDIVLLLNEDGETIVLDDLTNLSDKQLIIADCCRSSYTLQPVNLDSVITESTALSMSRDPVRQAYEERIEECAPQEIILFACAEGETAKDTVDENIRSYSQHLLDATRMILDEARSPFVRVSQSHARARGLIWKNPLLQQRPRIIQPNLPIHQRLPFAVNPEFF